MFADALTDTDMYRIVLNNGFMALFVVWVLFKGEPRYREMIEKMEATHKTTIDKLTTDHKTVVEVIVKGHETVIANLHKECREERKEIMSAITKEGELNRQNRHDTAQTMMSAIGEVYRGSTRDRTKNPPNSVGSGPHIPIT